MKKSVLTLLVLASLNSVSSVWAQEVTRVDEIVVQETEDVKAMEERQQSSSAKIVITKKEMEELGGQSAADVLRRMPRTYFSGPPAYNQDIRMSGLDKEFQNVMINGVRPPGNGDKREFKLELIPIELIDRIEIIKSPTAEYDSDAIGGLVNIILKNPPKNGSTMSVALGTSYNSLAEHWGNKIGLNYGDTVGKGSYTIGAVRNDEYKSKEKETIDTKAGTSKLEDEDTQVITTSLNPVITYRTDDQVFTFRPALFEKIERKTKDVPTYTLSTGLLKTKNIESENNNNNLDSYALEWERRLQDGALLKMSATHSENIEDKDKTTSTYNAAMTLTQTSIEKELKNEKEMVLTADYRKTFSNVWSADHIVSLGVKHREKDRLQQKTKNTTKNGTTTAEDLPQENFSLEENVSSFYVMDEAILNDRLTITPGMRMERTNGNYVTSAGDTGEGSYTDWNPSLHTVYKMDHGYQLRMSAVKTIARPSFKDMVPTRKVNSTEMTIELGNKDLKPARSENFDIAIEKYIGKNSIISLGAFSKNIADTIEKQEFEGTGDDEGYTIKKPVNVGDSKVKGLELEVKTDLNSIGWKNFMLTGSYALVDSKVKDLTTGQMRTLKDVPEKMGSLVLRYDNKNSGWGASLGLSYIGEKVNSENLSAIKVEQPFTQWDASITKKMDNGTQWFVSAVNLFNEKKVKIEPTKTEIENTGRSYYFGMNREI